MELESDEILDYIFFGYILKRREKLWLKSVCVTYMLVILFWKINKISPVLTIPFHFLELMSEVKGHEFQLLIFPL